ncbi:MAG: retropepsin-like aspartic protease [Xanthomonadales bacterium]|nr:retropepsin-like aspartic protease [Xanthomonadales bacterium]
MHVRINKKIIGLVTRILCTALLCTVAPVTLSADWLPFRLERGHIMVDVQVAGVPAEAMLDSGAMANMISNRFIEKHELEFARSGKVRAKGVNSVETIPLYNNVPLSIYGVDISLDKVAASSFRSADLILGSGFFRSGILQIDYPNSRLRFLDKKAVDLKKHANVSMRQASESLLPAVEIVLQGEETWLLFDTGNSGGLVLKRSFALGRGLYDDNTASEQFIAAGINTIATYERFALDSVIVGPYELTDVVTAIPAEGQSANIGERQYAATGTRLQRGVKTNGLLGYDVLKHFVITVDYKNYRMHIHAP